MTNLCIPTSPLTSSLFKRPRRNRKSQAIRDLIQETHLHTSHLVAPLFVTEGERKKDPILSMPEVFRYSLDNLLFEVESLCKNGIQTVDLFMYVPPDRKDPTGSEAIRPGNLLQKSIHALKQEFPELCVMADIALDPFTDHGHDGLVNEKGEIENDATLEILAQMCLLAAEAGADIVAPSDMMDGRIGYIRQALDNGGHINVSILSYAAKYASSFYGPFRDALQSAPKFGNKKTYQLNPANSREALLDVPWMKQKAPTFFSSNPPSLIWILSQKFVKEPTFLLAPIKSVENIRLSWQLLKMDGSMPMLLF